ncbi:MAG: ABC transporter transmembrane domain-containing protein [Oligoflexia bacterium]|nr:ABC transporter transmembrane domain-containing protein [Oligoflexia bacterium]
MRNLLKLKPYLMPHIWAIVASGLLAIPLSALRAAPAPLIKYYIDNLLVDHSRHKLFFFPILVIVLYSLNFIVRFLHYYFIRLVTTRVAEKLKGDLFRHIVGLSSDYFTTQSTGKLISRVSNDTSYVDGAISSINTLIREPMTFLVLLGYALKLHWKLTAVTFILFPPLAMLFKVTGKHLKRYVHNINAENGNLISTLQESFTGIRIVKTFSLEGYVQSKFERQLQTFTDMILKCVRMEEASHPAVELLFAFIIASILFFGSLQVLKGHITPGDLMAFFLTFGLMTNPIRTMNEVNIKLHQADSACERIFEIFSWKSRLYVSPAPKPIHELKEGVRFRDVRFAYPDSPQREVIKGINLQIPRGKVVALVGHSGSGKSSIASLLPRLFDVTGGSIEIDGIDVREYELHQLRDMISVVSQEVFLFNDTIEENIRCGRLNATDEEVREAARKAHADEFIAKLPDGYRSIVGDRGHKLSGGERQRVSIARAFLRGSPILILDEATSSLDTNSERIVQAVLDELIVTRTTLVIAHRLSTIRNAHRIAVMREGHIIELGQHDELMASGGEYFKLYQLS